MITKTKKNTTGWNSPIAIHPGRFLKETLGDFHMSQYDLAKRIGLSKKVVNEIIKGKNSITRATAFKLSKVFPISEEYWVNLQSIYENDRARLEEEARIKEDVKKYLQNFGETYKELTRIGFTSGMRWLPQNEGGIVLELQKFYAADSLSYVEKEIELVSFRKYKRDHLNYYTLAAWLRLGKIKAQQTTVQAFDEERLLKSLPNIISLSRKNPHQYLPQLEQILSECGIVLAYMPYLKNTHVQAAATWIGKDKALIMLNTTKKSEDRFWFNLLHEIAHILKHSKKELFVDLENGESQNKEEDEADKFAQESLIPNFQKVVSDFKSYPNHKEAIEKIAEKIGISPSILAGRIAYELKRQGKNVYAILNKFFETKINYINIKN